MPLEKYAHRIELTKDKIIVYRLLPNEQDMLLYEYALSDISDGAMSFEQFAKRLGEDLLFDMPEVQSLLDQS